MENTKVVGLARTIEEHGLDGSRFEVVAPGPKRKAAAKGIASFVFRAIGPLLKGRGFGEPSGGMATASSGPRCTCSRSKCDPRTGAEIGEGFWVFVWLGCFARAAHAKHADVVPASEADCEVRRHLWKRREQVETTRAVDSVPSSPVGWLVDEDGAYLPWVAEEIRICVETDVCRGSKTSFRHRSRRARADARRTRTSPRCRRCRCGTTIPIGGRSTRGRRKSTVL